MSRLLQYALLITFILAILVIVFLQFNSNRNIDALINGNDDLLDELSLKNDLLQLRNDVVLLDNKSKSFTLENKRDSTNSLSAEINKVETSLARVDNLKPDAFLTPHFAQLKRMVREKVAYTRSLVFIFEKNGRPGAEQYRLSGSGEKLTDSISSKSQQIDSLHEQGLKELILKMDANGAKAKTMGNLVAIIAALASIFTFLYIVSKVRQQQHLIGRLNDSERKTVEAAQIKENFLANMSHEIRTPMNAIIGFTNILERRQLDPDSKKMVSAIHKSGENLLSLVNDILDISKIEAGMMRIETAPFNIKEIIRSVVDLFREKIREKNLVLDYLLEDEVPDFLLGDETRLAQILVNLLSNAIKFTNEGSIVFRVANDGRRGEKIDLGIYLKDTGIGIEPAKLSKIFDRFEQVKAGASKSQSGTGLGLAIVKELVTLQHGKIDVKSRLGEGTEFHVQIPYLIADSDENSSTLYFDDPSTQVEKFEKNKVLVAEDNEINQSLMDHLLTEWGVDFKIVNNGGEALEAIRSESFDLVFMDIQMPVMDGYTAVKEICGILNNNITIVAMTAHAFEGEKQKCLSAGMNDYISKPINERELYGILKKYLGIHHTKANIAEQEHEHHFKTIDLSYMRSISSGNHRYEKLVTKQFIDAIPNDLNLLRSSLETGDIPTVQRLAHNLKTTVAIMGLNTKLNSVLESLEHDTVNAVQVPEKLNLLENVCNAALSEAQSFYQTLS